MIENPHELVEVLREARDIILDRVNWSRGKLRREGPDGVQLCALGALDVALRNHLNIARTAAFDFLQFSASGLFGRSVATVNDAWEGDLGCDPFDAVHQIYAHAIKQAEALSTTSDKE